MQGKSGIRTQSSFTHGFPFCSLLLFCRALTGGIQNGPILVVPWQVNTTNLNPGKMITLTPSATTRVDFPWGKMHKGQKTTASLPLYPGVLLSKGAHSCQASCSSCRWVMAGFGAPWCIPHLQGWGGSLSFTLHFSELAAECRKKPGT